MSGIVTIASHHAVDDTVARLQRLLEQKGVKIFTLVDHSGEAARAGLSMPNTKLVIFGNPQAGTPLMLAAPTLALDLPMKILIWEDAQGKCWITYNSAEFLSQRHHLPPALAPALAPALNGAAALAEQIALAF